MAKKQKKRRNKKYRGTGAMPEKPVVHRYEAEKKSKLREYFEENKITLIRNGVIAAIIGIALSLAF